MVPGAVPIVVASPPTSVQEICAAAYRAEAAVKSRGCPRDALIGVYCRKGVRAAMIASMLRVMGWGNVHSLGGVDTVNLPIAR